MTMLHPAVKDGVQRGKDDFGGGDIVCDCAKDAVVVSIKGNSAFNHLCGCTKCWKPAGATFSIVAVVPRENLAVTKNEQKLKLVDAGAPIKRHACTDCGVHMYGRIEDKSHPFYGFDFIHTEKGQDKGWSAPEFAAFVSSIIEAGVPPSKLTGIRKQLLDLGLQPYDCLSPPLMDLIAIHAAKAKGTYVEG